MTDDISGAIATLFARYPGSNREVFDARFPDPVVFDRVQAFVGEALGVPDLTEPLTLQEIGAQVRDTMRERHPELTDAALRALSNVVTYQLR